MPTAPLTGSRYPASTDVPNVPQFIQNAVYDLEDNTIPRFANAAARTTAFNAWVAAGNTLTDGLLCYMQDDHRLWRYDGVAGAWSWEHSAQGTVNGGYATYSNATPLALSNAFAVLGAFSVSGLAIPANRRLRISWHGVVSTTVAGDVFLFSMYMNQGSGGQIRNVTVDQRLASTQYPVFMQQCVTPAAGNWNFQIGAQRVSGSGTTSLFSGNAAEGASELLIEDIGAAT